MLADVRPALKSGLLPVWRDRDTLQFGVDPRRAIALSGMGQAAPLIGLLDGSRDREQIIAAAVADGIPEAAAERVLTLLAARGALDDYPAAVLRAAPQPLRQRLSAELATTSLAHADADGGARALSRRKAARVEVRGERRIGRAIVRILHTAGVGRTIAVLGHGSASETSTRPATSTSTRPGIGARSGRAATPHPPASAIPPDLVILVGAQPPDLADQLVRARIAHLAVGADEAIGIVGPMVLPGTTACLRCLDYTRAGNDPAWPLILAQLAARRPAQQACDAALAAAVAAQAAAQALIAIDRSAAACAAAGGTLELVLPGWQWRRRSWPLHPACLCCATRPAPLPPP